MNRVAEKRESRDRTAEGVCLRRLDYGNSSQVVTFLTPVHGRIDCMIKGIWRRPKKGISAGIDLLGRYSLLYRRRPSDALNVLFDFHMIDHFSGMRRSVERAVCGYYAVELMRHFTACEQDCGDLYSALLTALQGFAGGRGLGMCALRLEMDVLKHHGSCPDFSSCVRCGNGWRQDEMLYFSGYEGGVVCDRCSGGSRPSGGPGTTVPVQAPVARLLDSIDRGLHGEAFAAPARIVAAGRALRCHMACLLGKELCMWKYLQGRHYSRSLDRIRNVK